VFSITEGPEVLVRGIEFTGNTFVSGPVLRLQVLSSKRLVDQDDSPKPYAPARVKADVERLRKFYRSFGYHDVRVSREVQWDSDLKAVVLVFHIREGERYRIKAAPEVIGQTSASGEELNRVIQVRAGDYYSQRKIDTDVTHLKDFIGYTGRLANVQDRVFLVK